MNEQEKQYNIDMLKQCENLTERERLSLENPYIAINKVFAIYDRLERVAIENEPSNKKPYEYK